MKQFSHRFLTLSLLTSLLWSNSAGADPVFTDVAEPFAYTSSISWAKENNLIKGYDDGSFRPREQLNRAEALTMIMRLSKMDGIVDEDTADLEGSENIFWDVSEDSWYNDVVQEASEKGVIKGSKEGQFEPEKKVNRAEAMKMLIRATGKTKDLPNIASDPWFAPYMEYSKIHAILIPDKNGDLLPGQNLSRGEMVEIMYRLVNEPYENHIEYGVASYYGWSYDGHNTASGKALDAHGKMAAHKTLPFGTKLRVTNVDSLNSVIVEVVDRGPYTKGYVVDLTPAAFEVLEPLSVGLSQVRVEVLK